MEIYCEANIGICPPTARLYHPSRRTSHPGLHPQNTTRRDRVENIRPLRASCLGGRMASDATSAMPYPVETRLIASLHFGHDLFGQDSRKKNNMRGRGRCGALCVVCRDAINRVSTGPGPCRRCIKRMQEARRGRIFSTRIKPPSNAFAAVSLMQFQHQMASMGLGSKIFDPYGPPVWACPDLFGGDDCRFSHSPRRIIAKLSTFAETVPLSAGSSPRLWRRPRCQQEAFHKCGDCRVVSRKVSTFAETSPMSTRSSPHLRKPPRC
jgi:hypothetical protein